MNFFDYTAVVLELIKPSQIRHKPSCRLLKESCSQTDQQQIKEMLWAFCKLNHSSEVESLEVCCSEKKKKIRIVCYRGKKHAVSLLFLTVTQFDIIWYGFLSCWGYIFSLKCVFLLLFLFFKKKSGSSIKHTWFCVTSTSWVFFFFKCAFLMDIHSVVCDMGI